MEDNGPDELPLRPAVGQVGMKTPIVELKNTFGSHLIMGMGIDDPAQGGLLIAQDVQGLTHMVEQDLVSILEDKTTVSDPITEYFIECPGDSS